MEHISQYLNDPAWWFATVLVGILASLVAAYLKDYIGRFFASLSLHYRTRKEKSDRRQQLLVAEWAEDTTLLLLANLTVIRSLIVFVALLACFFGMSFMSISALPLGTPKSIAMYLSLAVGVATILHGYKGLNRLRLVIQSNALYRKRAVSASPNPAVNSGAAR